MLCSDVSLSSVDDFDTFYESALSQPASPGERLHEAIFCISGSHFRFVRTASVENGESDIMQRIKRTSSNNGIAPMEVSGEIGGKISWGGENGVQGSGHVSGKASDDNGNKVDVKVEVNTDGSGNASITASHEEK